MKNTTKRYWKGVEELRNDTQFVKHANTEFNNGTTQDELLGNTPQRRDFLKAMGFSVAAVSLAACEAPVRKAIPYLNKPEFTFPSISDYYASTYSEGGDYAPVLVETREGRPIKIEGNPASSITRGGTTARVQASVLSLYDIDKLKGPKRGDADIDWATADREILSQLNTVAGRGGAIRIVTGSIISPSTKAVVADFIAKYPTARHIMYDANSVSGLIQANQLSFGQAVIPSYRFDQAQTIVSIGADFLGTWVAPLEFARPYAETRKIGATKKNMSRHYQFETIMSMTGGNADYRGTYKPSQEGLVVAALYNKVASKLGGASIPGISAVEVEYLDKAATDLAASRGRSLVVCGSNDPNVQIVVNALNSLLGGYGTTIDLGTPLNYRQGNDGQMNAFINEAKAGTAQAVMFFGVNPVYDHPRGAELAAALPKMALSLSFADRADETASLCKYITPAPHYLECWGDAEPKRGFYSIMQPAITHIFKTRQFQSSLLKWAGRPDDFQAYLKNYWRTNLYPQASGFASFDAFWIQTLNDGVFEPNKGAASATGASFNAGLVGQAGAAIAQRYRPTNGMELALYEKVGIGPGALANNPWLQELPDPVTKATWDNYATVSQKTAKDNGWEQNDMVSVSVDGKTAIELPVLIQPGQADNTVGVAIGYGRTKAGRSANEVGKNAYPLASFANGYLNMAAVNAKVEGASGRREIAQTQTHETVMGRRAVLQEATLAAYKKDKAAGKYSPKVETSEGPVTPTDITLWNGYGKPNHSWGMVIDLNSCIGCGACVVGCNSENNIQVVGRDEVIMRREMHWMRIDRYYSSDGEEGDYKALEVASANPEVTYMPMLCQHCSNAPCETVCPVLATTHSTEGLNQMTYNRCIGTRYCANNCPYKVRRFNWFKYFDNDNFDYHFNNDLGKMVINPDVTVRSRGVIEKCSFCVQRIQEGKLTAKKERRRLLPDEVQVACAQACPTNAIVFGDMNNPESTISKVLASELESRAFHVLEEINVRPQISYLTKIRNKDEAPKQESVQESQA